MNSDFLAMRDCPYIEFGTIDKTTRSAVVFRRATTASLLGLHLEQQLVELCILCGNDFTKSPRFDASQYIEAPPCSTEKSRSDESLVASSVEWLRLQGPDFKAESVKNAELRLAIQYSRAFYDLDDLRELRDELQNYRDSISYSKPLSKLSMKLSLQQKENFDTWIKARAPRNISPGRVVLEYFESQKFSLEELPVTLNGSMAFISANHICAISRMLDIIADPAVIDYSSNALRLSARYVPIPIPSWKDVIASHIYQMLVIYTLDYSEGIGDMDIDSTWHPLRIFDGPLFHILLEISKKESSLRTLPQAVAPSSENAETLVNNFQKMSISAMKDKPENRALPIDAYREEILHRIDRDRVVIIHGETGCGKSSRVPAMLLESSKDTGKRCKMMISQPRRIAASSLMKRLRQTIGDEVGMRMGHGVKDESADTKLFFVTTGYLVRLLAYHPEYFDSHTHLIIDEVHERSVDGDVLCYLAKRMLSRHPTIKLVLMSATMHIGLYQDYFAPTDLIYYGDLQCLSVGARRFPLEMFHTDTMCSKSGIPSVFKPLCENITKKLMKVDSSATPDPAFIKLQYSLVNHIIREIVEPGTGVLVFVSGMSDINELSDMFENESKYVVIPIHSDIPFEEQEVAFNPVEENQIKVVLATNAAESSITLPDVDVVICLGTHKAVRYDAATSHVQLANQFISKASATQRAGRTGRTRPGKVFRLYSSKLFEEMNDHDLPEVMRKPLEDVILNLRAMLEDSSDFIGVVPILESLLERPKTENISTSFCQLHRYGMITMPGDDGELTPVGRMAGNLPVDLHLSRMIALGIALGVGAEVVAIAAAMTIPKTPFRTAHHLIHKGMKLWWA